MLSAPLRYACIAAMLVCNALFFWNVEARTDTLLAFAFGTPQQANSVSRQTVVTQTQIKQTSAFTFADPARLNRASR